MRGPLTSTGYDHQRAAGFVIRFTRRPYLAPTPGCNHAPAAMRSPTMLIRSTALIITWQRDPEGLFYQAIKLAHAGDLDREVEILAPRCHDRRVARCRSAAHGRRPGRR